LLDLGDEPGEGVCFAVAVAVVFDDGAQLGVAVEGGAAEPGAGGDLVEGDGLVCGDKVEAGLLDALEAVLAHPAASAAWMCASRRAMSWW
jgi:hypothetical protein